MSKKPVPSKKQAVSSTRSRHATYVRNKRIKMENSNVLDVCKSCGAKKRRHFVCSECGKYNDRVVIKQKSVETKKAPIKEIKA